MLHRKQSGLKLNSYKIDTDQLQNSLRELSEMKESMETTISHYKQNEDQLMLENERLKQEIAMLQKKTDNKPDYSNYQTKILKLEEQLKDQKKETEKCRKMHEAERRSKEIVVAEYEAKLRSHMTESKIQVDNYQQRIAALAVELKQSKIMNEINQKHIKQLSQIRKKEYVPDFIKASTGKKDSDSDNYRSESQPQYTPHLFSRNSMPHPEDEHKHMKIAEEPKQPKYIVSMPPKSPSSREYQTSKNLGENKHGNTLMSSYSAGYMPSSDDQQIFLASIRKLYHETKQMGLSANEIRVLPQFKKMTALQNPSRKDLLMFFKQSPIEEASKQNAQRNCRFIQNSIRSKHGQVTGKLVTEAIIARVQDYENSSKLNTEDLQISDMTPSLSKGLSYGRISNANQQRQQKLAYSYHNSHSRASIHDNLHFNTEQEYSHF